MSNVVCDSIQKSNVECRVAVCLWFGCGSDLNVLPPFQQCFIVLGFACIIWPCFYGTSMYTCKAAARL